ncbi:probable voltage-dependent N-type calcium channel subunit alpha-1B isoform X8 [Hydra vulgaris]|uniref:Probable voltage-dependent N-type calcium channel subunit alpha-1B isoform X8 n=1 Tax=Hydra vulgaris TaxID=6087 RepID=A0ABM4C6M0_HYDVU
MDSSLQIDIKNSKIDEEPVTFGNENLYPKNHLCFLTPTNRFRMLCVAVLKSKPFEFLIIFTTLLNCVVMALNTPQPNSDRNAIDKTLDHIDVYILGIFCLEAFLKIISQGLFMHKYSYLRNPWNILDIMIIATGVLTQVIRNNSIWLKYIKLVRIFRPLKFLAKFESLHVLLATIIKSLALLFHVCIFTCFVISMYAIIGMSFLKGKFHYTCFWDSTNEIWKKEYLCGSNGNQCPKNTTCRRFWLGPNGGAISFDNFIISCITVFVCITCEGWTNIMYKTFEVADNLGNYFWIYYYTLEIIGAFIIMNLVRGVLSGGFSKQRSRISIRNFLISKRESKIKQISVKYVNWIDEAEKVLAKEAEKKLEKKRRDIRFPFLSKFVAFNSGIRTTLKKILLLPFFYWLMMFLTFLNALILVVQHYKQPQWVTDIKDVAQLVFMVFFLLEVILKLYALGLQLYFAKLSDKFEFVVMTLWLVDFFLLKYAGVNFSFFVLHQLQLFRLFQRTNIWESLKKLKTSIFASLSSVLNLILLLFVFAVIFALFGMNFFGGVFYNIIPKPRTSFDDFFNSLMVVFQIMMGEGWNYVMYDAIKANGGANKPLALLSSLYFIILNIVGKYVLINIFLAIAIDNILLAENQSKKFISTKKKALSLLKKKHKKFTKKKSVTAKKSAIATLHNIETPDNPSYDKDFIKDEHQNNVINDNEVLQQNLEKFVETNTLFICFPNNPLRKIVHKIVNAQSFNNLTLFFIIVSSGMLSLEDATNPEAKINKILIYFDIVFTVYFTFEVLLKVINFGFCFNSGAYCREIWNCFDLFILLANIISVILSLSETKSGVKWFLKILRFLRAFRCLRSVNKLPKLKLIINCIGSSIKNASGIMAAIVQSIFIFAVMGVQLFNGKLNYCTDESMTKKEDCSGFFISFDDHNYNLPVEKKREWFIDDFNFNHIGVALLSLISSSSGSGWPILMQSGIDSEGVDEGPLKNNKIWLSLYFIAFLITMSFFFINLFIGMIVYTFKKNSGKIEGELDRNSKICLDFVLKSKPQPCFMPKDVKSLKYKVWKLIESRFWNYFIVFIVLLNSAALLVEFDEQPCLYEEILEFISYVALFVFFLEAGIKIFAFRQNYFKDLWNLFDLLIVILGIIGFALDVDIKNCKSGYLQQDPSFSRIQPSFDTNIFSFFRVLRFIKLMQRVRPIRILIWTFLKSLQAFPHLGVLIFFVFYIYAVIGMQLFALISISHNDGENKRWLYINKYNNFRTFLSSLQVLFEVASGDNWPNIMMACINGAKCDNKLRAVQLDKMLFCGSDAAYFYFISFILFCYYLMLNLILAVIMDNFAYLTEDTSKLGPQHLDEVVMVWSNFDPRATGRIKHTEVIQLLKEMMPPVGLGPHCIKIVAYKRLVQMNMILYDDGSVDYTGFFFALVRTALNIYTKNANLQINNDAIRNMLLSIWPKITKRTLDLVIPRPPRNAKQMTIGKLYAAKLIVYNYRNIVQSKV